MDLRHGYTLADLERIGRSAAMNAGAYASDFVERYEIAYSAIAEVLFIEQKPPVEHDLFNAGRNAIWRALRASEHVWGMVSAKGGGYRRMVAFERYWTTHAPPSPSPEQVILDATAARQIIPTLTALQREALATYAAFGFSLPAAAEALGVSVKTLSARVDYARAAFLALWHEGETPTRKWRRNGSRRPDERLVPCGTDSAYFRHRRRGEPIDEACAGARATYAASMKQRRRERRPSEQAEATQAVRVDG